MGEVPGRVTVGSRVMVDDQFGTVKFIGEITSTNGQWLGIDWDDPSRGKHDGTHDGKRYFKAEQPTSGSFLRPKRGNYGQGFMAAVRDKYCSDEVAGDTIVVSKNVKFELFFNKVAGKQRSLDKLKELDLYGCGCYGLGSDDEISGVFPTVTYLSLRRCLIHSWAAVAEICQHLPRLNCLVVSENSLNGKEEFGVVCRNGFQTIEELVINSMNYSWEDVCLVMNMFPRVYTLRACYNDYPLMKEDVCLENLRLLEIQYCNIVSWEEVSKLSSLPHLEYLNVANNKISEIQIVEESFLQLTTLSLNNNLLNSFQSINELNRLPSLEVISIRQNPLETLNGFEPWENCIARIQRLKKVGGEVVNNIVRTSCELDYLKQYGFAFVRAGATQEMLDTGKLPDSLTSEHPRYVELVKKYGAPFVGDGTMPGSNMKHNIAKVTIKCNVDTTKPEVVKKIPLTMTVTKLKLLVSRLYKIDADSVEISYISENTPHLEIKMTNDLKELSFYSLEDGNTILVRF